MTVSTNRQNRMTYDKLHVHQLQRNQKNGNVTKRQYQTEIECNHSMGNDKSHALPFVLHYRELPHILHVYTTKRILVLCLSYNYLRNISMIAAI